MKLPAENTAKGVWLKKDQLKNGDRIKIVSEAKIEMGQNGEQLVAKALVQGQKEPGNVAINKITRRALVEVYGDDTLNWVDKVFTAHLERMMIDGQRKLGLFLVPEGFEVAEDENAYLVVQRIGSEHSPKPVEAGDFPVEEINPEDIPF